MQFEELLNAFKQTGLSVSVFEKTDLNFPEDEDSPVGFEDNPLDFMHTFKKATITVPRWYENSGLLMEIIINGLPITLWAESIVFLNNGLDVEFRYKTNFTIPLKDIKGLSADFNNNTLSFQLHISVRDSGDAAVNTEINNDLFHDPPGLTVRQSFKHHALQVNKQLTAIEKATNEMETASLINEVTTLIRTLSNEVIPYLPEVVQ